jgi:glycosyltransferase involved in cell wall biosynthesis
VRIVHLTAGTGSFLCGTCIRDNALVRGLRELGHEASLVPMYLPIVAEGGTCDADAPVRMGGIHVWMAENVPGFSWIPRAWTRPLASQSLLRRVAASAGSTQPEALGALTASMLRGVEGRQRGEVEALVADVVAMAPDAVVISNSLLGGLVAPLRDALRVPVAVAIQGEHHFVDAMGARWADALWPLVAAGLDGADARIAVSGFAADVMASRTGLARGRFDVVPNGVDPRWVGGRAEPEVPTWGFLARLVASKGPERALRLYGRLRARHPSLRLRIGGTLQPGDRAYVDALRRRAAEIGGDVEIVPNLDEEGKRALLASSTVFCVPTCKDETFGLYNVEAMAMGVPVVAPARGAIPEVLGAVGGGEVVPDDDDALIGALDVLLRDGARRASLASAGTSGVAAGWTELHMARAVGAILRARAPGVESVTS